MANKEPNCSDLRDVGDVFSDASTELWVSRVVRYSSQYDDRGWSAQRVIGASNVYPANGDHENAWAQGVCDAHQYIEIEYAKALYLEKLEIYETMNAGAVVHIKALAPSGDMVTLWQSHNGPSSVIGSRIFSPDLQRPEYPVKVFRLELDCTGADTWCELDAIKLTGKENNKAPPPSLSQQLFPLVNNCDHSNVSFLVDTRTVYAHGAILSARSPYFSAMFSSGMKESRNKKGIPIEGVSYAAFIGLLQYLYTNSLSRHVTAENMLELTRVADRFQAEGLTQLCFWFLGKELTEDNVLELYRSAVEDLPLLDDVRCLCLDFIAEHIDKLSRKEEFAKLSHALMLEIIQHSAGKMKV